MKQLALPLSIFPDGCKISAIGVLLIALASCSQPIAISVNNQTVYDPGGRIISNEAADADLQGCINLALRQQGLDSASELTVLSCPNSEIQNLENISQLQQARFLDLGNNNIGNITPLEDLPLLSGLNLANNRIQDIGPLFNIPSLVTVSLVGNNGIPCEQINALAARLGSNLTPPEACAN